MNKNTPAGAPKPAPEPKSQSTYNNGGSHKRGEVRPSYSGPKPPKK